MGKMKSLWQDKLEEAEESFMLRGDRERFIQDVSLLGISKIEANEMVDNIMEELKL